MGHTTGFDADWVDEVLLFGDDSDICLVLDRPVTRRELRALVAQRQAELAAHGLSAGGSAALRLPPSLAFITNLLAVWRTGAQAVLLDYRLTDYEVDAARQRLLPQVVIAPKTMPTPGPRGFFEVVEVVTPCPGRPAATPHAVIQLSSGSTGPSKVIGRTAANLIEEIHRYVQIPGVPRAGERIVVLASMVHVLGLVGGLLYGLYAGAQVAIPRRLMPDAIFDAIRIDDRPTTLLGVPFHVELLTAVAEPPKLPQLTGMTTGGELVRSAVHEAFVDRYQVRLGNMYGMTEVGVIATDIFGRHRPALAPAPGLRVCVEGGELLVSLPASPYVGLADPTRWADGWLHTRDAGTVRPETGLVTIQGRLDSQISVGGLKVDLTEVEHTLAAIPDVAGAVVVHDRGIAAYVTLADGGTPDSLDAALTTRLAAYKRPRRVHVLDQMPRTATGKLVRDPTVLRAAVSAGGEPRHSPR